MSKGRRTRLGTPGNPIAEAGQLAEMFYRTGVIVSKLPRLFDRTEDKEVALQSIKVTRLPQDRGGGFMVVVKGVDGGHPVVAFESGQDVVSVIKAAIEKYDQRVLKFKAEKPYKPENPLA